MDQQFKDNSQINVLDIAKAQKAIMWLVLISIVIMFIREARILYLPITIVNLYFTYKLLVALRFKLIFLWLIGMVLPFINLIILLILSSQATKVIRVQGYKVSLMGANINEIETRQQSSINL